MLKFLAILAAGLLSGCASVADAGGLTELTVINRSTGERLPVYRHRGRMYIEGRAGERYAVELRNRTGGRILAVLSVDGVNAITGQTAAASQSGYVLDPWRRAEIAGWRKDMSEVAAFYFTAFYHRVTPAVMTDQLMAEFHIGAAALGNFSAFYFYGYFLM
ncbi:MAG: hypothetical protein MUP61_04840, partial [Burkholderiales bacterium]|nr:hypothetical protein [Burkholderiales bacterium]